MRRVWNSRPMRFARDVMSTFFRINVFRAAAELAYFLILSFFPILICVNAFVGALHVNPQHILSVLEPILPPSLLTVVGEYLRYITVNASPVLLAAGLFMTLISASAAMRSLMNIMGEMYGMRIYRGFRQILFSVLFSILLLVTIYLSFAVVLTGNWFFHVLENYLPFDLNWGDGGSWSWIRFLLLFGMVLLLILLVYRLSFPRKKRPRPPVLGGAFAAAVLLVAASALFSWFIGLSSRYSLVYGSLASVAIMLLWLYLCGNILIMGNIFNWVWFKHKLAKKAREKGGRKKEEEN